MMPHRKYGSQDTRNTVTVVNRTHLEVGKMGRVKLKVEKREGGVTCGSSPCGR